MTVKWLHEFKTVNGRFTKSKFAKGIVSPRQRYRFAVWKTMFEAMKHGLWRGESLPFAVRKLVFRKMKNKEWRVKNHVLHNLTSLSSLFPDKILSILMITIITSKTNHNIYMVARLSYQLHLKNIKNISETSNILKLFVSLLHSVEVVCSECITGTA